MNYDLPKNYWKEKDSEGVKVPKDELLNMIEEYIKKHNVMGFATCHDNIVRNTPLEYEYYKGAFWFLSEGGKKFEGLEVNKNVSIVIFDQMEKGVCRGLQAMGIAHVIEYEDPEYVAYFSHRKLSPDALAKRLSYPMPLVRVEVKEFDYFDMALAKKNYYVRQHLDM